MTLGRRLAAVLALAVLGLAGAAGVAPRASADVPLPYLAYGMGLSAGQVVEAYLGETSVGRTKADTAGNWKMLIPLGGASGGASNGDRITFSVDGKPTGRSLEFQSGRFPAPPGLQLGAAPVTHPTPAPKATPSPRPSVTTRAMPRPACIRPGRPVGCVAVPTTPASTLR